jgi:hypothetical protein
MACLIAGITCSIVYDMVLTPPQEINKTCTYYIDASFIAANFK